MVKLSQELKEEQEMNRCLRANQAQLQSQLAEEERKGKESGEFNSVAAQRWSSCSGTRWNTLLDKHSSWRKSECFYGSALITVLSGFCVFVCPSVPRVSLAHLLLRLNKRDDFDIKYPQKKNCQTKESRATGTCPGQDFTALVCLKLFSCLGAVSQRALPHSDGNICK